MSIIEHLTHPVINALGWTVLHSLWQVALIALLWFLVMKGIQKHAANVRYNISLLALLAIPACFVFTFFRQYAIYSNARQVVSVEFEEMAWMAMDGSRQFFLIDKGHPDLLGRFESLTPWVFWLYLAGMTLFAVHAAFAYSRMFSLKRKNIRSVPEEWMQRYQKLKQKTGLQIQVPVWLSSRVDIPMVVGFFKPVILLPLSMLSSLPPEQVEIILLHELYHIKRKDHYINAAQTLLEILFFYHPATWWISGRIRKERESRVDEWIVAEINNPTIYARALVSLEEKRGNRVMQPALAATQSKNQLFTRIKHLMTMKTRKFNAGQKLAALLALVFAFISVAWINPAKTSNIPSGNNSYIDMYPTPEDELHDDFTGKAAGLESQQSSLNQSVVPEPRQAVANQYDGQEPKETAPDQYTGQGELSSGDIHQRDSVIMDRTKLGEKREEIRNIHLHDGTVITWDTLSEKDREEIRRAIEETRIAIQEMNKELQETLHSEEFRREIQQSQQEFQEAMLEIQEQYQHEDFEKEMQKVGEEYRKAMEELKEEFQSEEFQKEMQQLGEEMRKAMEEIRVEFQSEEFQKEMQQASESFHEGMEELRIQFKNEDFQREMKEAMEELRITLEALQAAEREKAKEPEKEKR
ncbi:MAG: M56 family metallopeptidase [Bacteroidales bacterium]